MQPQLCPHYLFKMPPISAYQDAAFLPQQQKESAVHFTPRFEIQCHVTLNAKELAINNAFNKSELRRG